MPIFLTSLLTSFLGGLLEFFTRFLTRKVAVAVTFVAVMATMVGIFIVALTALFSTISYALPSFMSDAYGMFMPSNFEFCLTAIYSARVARFIFDRNREIVNGQVRIFS